VPPRDAAPRMTVPFCDVGAINRELSPQLESAFRRVMSRGQFVLGQEVDLFEREWAAYCGKRHAVGVGNATDAMIMMLRACDIGPGDEVIVPAHTYIATWMAVSGVGATPVPVDADDSFLIDVNKIQAALTPKTRAILAVHLYGKPCAMEALRTIARTESLALLIDAAQAHGMTGDMLGDAAAFSFYPTKNLGALGDGGAVVTDNTDIASRIALFRSYGSITKNRHEVVSGNSRLDELQAAFLRAKLPYLDRFNARRFSNASKYGLATRGVHHQAVATIRNRETYRQKMAQRGIETMVHYPTPPHLQPAYAHLGYGRDSFPVAERLAREVVSFPVGPELSPDQVEHVATEWARP